jgi:hypothetical protein
MVMAAPQGVADMELLQEVLSMERHLELQRGAINDQTMTAMAVLPEEAVDMELQKDVTNDQTMTAMAVLPEGVDTVVSSNNPVEHLTEVVDRMMTVMVVPREEAVAFSSINLVHLSNISHLAERLMEVVVRMAVALTTWLGLLILLLSTPEAPETRACLTTCSDRSIAISSNWRTKVLMKHIWSSSIKASLAAVEVVETQLHRTWGYAFSSIL